MQQSPASPRTGAGCLRRALRGVGVVLATTVVLLGAAVPAASAHDELVSTMPAAGATVPARPATVTLDFSGAIQALGTQVLVTGPNGAAVSVGAVEVRTGTVVQPLAAGVTAGVHTVAWRVSSSDGHPLAGEFDFTVAASAGATAGTPPAEELAEQPADVPAAAPQPSGTSFPVGPLAVGAGLLAVAGGLVLLRRRRT